MENNLVVNSIGQKSTPKIIWVIVGLAILVLMGFIGSSWAASYYFKRGDQLFDARDYKGARAALNQSLRFRPNNPLPYSYFGWMAAHPIELEAKPNYQEAISHYEHALSLGLEKAKYPAGKFYTETLHDIATIYRELGQYDKANEKYLQKIALSPSSSFFARYWVAKDYYDRANKPAEALEILLPAPDSVDVDFNFVFKTYKILANLYDYFGDYQNSEKYARLAIENIPSGTKDLDAAGAHVFLARALAKKGELASAEAEIKKANELENSKDLFTCFLASIYADRKEYARAIATAQAVKAKSPLFQGGCLAALGDAYLGQNNKTGAKKYFEEYLKITEGIGLKNIFVVRKIEQIKKAVEGL